MLLYQQIKDIEKRKIKSIVIWAFCGGGFVIFSLNHHLFLFSWVFSGVRLVKGWKSENILRSGFHYEDEFWNRKNRNEEPF